MKATLEFNLPEEKSEFNFANNGAHWWHVCWQMDVWLRANIKYAPDEQSDEVFEAYELCREELRKIIDAYKNGFYDNHSLRREINSETEKYYNEVFKTK